MPPEDAHGDGRVGRAGAGEILAALERTVGQGTVRIELRFESSTEYPTQLIGRARGSQAARRPPGGSPRRRLQARFFERLVDVLAWSMQRLLRRWERKERPRAGVLDFVGQRCMYGTPSPSTAELVVGDRMWKGPFPTAAESEGGDPASTLQPLWLLDLVRGVVSAREQAVETLDGRTCRHFLALADLNRAAEAVSYPMAIPTGMERLDHLTRIGVEVWVDDGGDIRRIRHTGYYRHAEDGGVPLSTVTVDLIEFGVELPAAWAGLPSVRDSGSSG